MLGQKLCKQSAVPDLRSRLTNPSFIANGIVPARDRIVGCLDEDLYDDVGQGHNGSSGGVHLFFPQVNISDSRRESSCIMFAI
ncbi:hypothetical protein [Rhizobium leguminosarum]|uniref:hypothetical protein n=1 Tax=Rhizobium leguminosarum TaxID=384 RepID=UPI0012BB8CC8|nr:hypothetical protein [Rhizobium leguminosarum]